MGVEGEAPDLEGLRLQNGAVIPLDGLFVPPQVEIGCSLIEQLGSRLEDTSFGPVVSTDTFKRTSVLGVFAAGDVARSPHSVTLAVADGAWAGTAVHQSLVFGAVPMENGGG